jgi:hypothetical protein
MLSELSRHGMHMATKLEAPLPRAASLISLFALLFCGACEAVSVAPLPDYGPAPPVDHGFDPGPPDPGPPDLGPPADPGFDEAEPEPDPGPPPIDPGPDIPDIPAVDEGVTVVDEGADIVEPVDTGPEIEPAELGDPCRTGAECASGMCVAGSPGDMCTVPCTGECPEGWECRLGAADGGEPTLLCLEPLGYLCRPCATEEDCGPTQADDGANRCLRFTPIEGSFCSEPCTGTEGCPHGFECTELTVSAKLVNRCLPEGGRCECSETAVQEEAWTECSRENEIGTCTGTRTCSDEGLGPCNAPAASAETCDGEDNDCDGETDNGLTLGPCEKQGDEGSCQGQEHCVGGEIVCDAPDPVPEICNAEDDDCDGTVDDGFEDLDGDGDAYCVDPDDDGDGIEDVTDVCPQTPDPEQIDTDGDLEGDACDEDDDGDGVGDEADLCPLDPDPAQTDTDGDREGDACDEDDDGDTVGDDVDVCPLVPDPEQKDSDGDGRGDACDGDRDGDGIADDLDLCPDTASRDQRDPDRDGKANPCDEDDDGDGVEDVDDVCPETVDPGQEDTDGDRLGDACDADDDADGVTDTADKCPLVFDPEQIDTDDDGKGDACDEDDDGDGVGDEEDVCPLLADPGQADTDADKKGNACDEDDDGDGVEDGVDVCPLVVDPEQIDTDGDGLGDACESDSDGDGIPDPVDVCPTVKDPGQGDLDQDGQGDACDDDDDNDGLNDSEDVCPRHPDAAQTDTDGDKQGDACDEDDDADGTPDADDCSPLDAMVGPGMPEVCNGIDDNCDGAKDVQGSTGCNDFYQDLDEDGFGGPQLSPRCLCQADEALKFTANKDGDCNELDKLIYPGAPERCNALDDDCDDERDETFPGLDVRCDGPDIDECAYGVMVCSEDGQGTTCSEESPSDIKEMCNGADDDCDGRVDEGFDDTDDDGKADCVDFDDDNDGTPDVADCAPLDRRIAPGAEEICDDGLDNDCDPETVCTILRWDNGAGAAPVTPLHITEPAADWYSYGDPVESSANVPGLAVSGTVQMGLLDRDANGLYFVVIIDAHGDAEGGRLTMNLDGYGIASVGAEVVAHDDPEADDDHYQWSGWAGTGEFSWKWGSCCTDGMVLGPFPAGGPFCLRPSFDNVDGIDSYEIFGPPRGSFARINIPAHLVEGLEICVEP